MKHRLVLAGLLALAGCDDMGQARQACSTVPYAWQSLCVQQQMQAIQDRRTNAMLLMGASLQTMQPQPPVYAPAVGTTSCRWVGGQWLCNSW